MSSKTDLANQWLLNRETEEYMERVESGTKTAQDFAGQYLYMYPESALEKFKRDCEDLEKDFFYEIVNLLIKATSQLGSKK